MKSISSTLLDSSLFYYGVILFASCVFLFALLEIYVDRRKHLWNIPGPLPLPLLGNSLLLVKRKNELFIPTLKAVSRSNWKLIFYNEFWQLLDKYGSVIRFHLGTRPNLLVGSSPEAFEKIMSSNKQITKVTLKFQTPLKWNAVKGKDYKFLLPWLGTGLLISTGSKWHSR